MAKKDETPKTVLEREYIVPLRQGWLKVPEYKRANKAAKTLKEFIVKHMKVYDRDLRKVKIGVDLNNELRFRGMKKPPAKIKVKAIKFEDDIVRVELVDLPKHLEFKKKREEKNEKKKSASKEVAATGNEAPKEEKVEGTKEKKEEKETKKEDKSTKEEKEKEAAKETKK